ncbi:MAG TPA: hypothetical protein VHK06_06955, partial [Candidatus Limnocylindria bacterium]|nr:hypothetical protein [Candidatus Limnocylindria bacterium]
DGRIRLAPPRGGYLVSALPLDAAMRLLGGSHRRLLVVGIGLVGAGLVAAAVGLLIGLALVVAGG